MKTLVVIKPDGVARRLVGAIIGRFEEAGMDIAALRMLRLPPEKAEELYAIHRDKPFYPGLLDYITAGPIVPLLVDVNTADHGQAVEEVRNVVGATKPWEAATGTIRGDFGIKDQPEGRIENLVHASDSPQTFKTEAPLFFSEEELHA